MDNNNSNNCTKPSKSNIISDDDINEYLNIDHEKWLAEKPISVLQLDPADRAVLKIADRSVKFHIMTPTRNYFFQFTFKTFNDSSRYNLILVKFQDQRDKIQKKTFTKWINKHLNTLSLNITDLFEDLRDGNNLISLLELLSQKCLRRERGQTRFHSLENVRICLDFLTECKVRIVNIRSDEIVDGNPKLTLGLIWMIILHFQIMSIIDRYADRNFLINQDSKISDITLQSHGNDFTAKEALKVWAQKQLNGYNGVHITDFVYSWKNGRAFLAILHRHRPETVNIEKMYSSSNKENLQDAFDIAEREFGVTKLLDPEDVDVTTPDEKSIITYVSLLYDAMPNIPVHPNQMLNNRDKRALLEEYSSLAKYLLIWITDSINQMSSKLCPSDSVQIRSLLADIKTFRLEKLKPNVLNKTKLAQIYCELQSFYGKSIPIPMDEQLSYIEKLWNKLENTVQNRENLLERARSKYSQLNEMFDRLSKESIYLNEMLDEEQKELNKFLEHDFKTRQSAVDKLERIENEVKKIDQQLRNALKETAFLKDEKYPNIIILTEKFRNAQQRVLDLLVLINSPSVKDKTRLKHTNTLNTNPTSIIYSTGTTTKSDNSVKLKSKDDPNSQISNNVFVNTIKSINNPKAKIKSAIEWIELKHAEASSLVYKTDANEIQRQLDVLHKINEDVQKILPIIQEIYDLKDDELESDSNELESAYNKLCKILKKQQKDFSELFEFLKLFNEELRFMNDIEDVELNRDWSQPSSLNSVELLKYKKDVDLKLQYRSPKIKFILNLGERLIDDEDHPATKDIKISLLTIKNELNWVFQLMDLLGVHLVDLKNNERFNEDYDRINRTLDQIDVKIIGLKSVLDRNKGNDIVNELNEFNQLKHSFDTFCKTSTDLYKNLTELAHKMHPLKMRSRRLQHPYNKCQIQTQYAITGFMIHEGEPCEIEDNSNKIKWKVYFHDKHTTATIPSVCFVLPSPDIESIDLVRKLKLKHERIHDDVNSLYFKFKYENIMSLMKKTSLLCDINDSSNIQTVNEQQIRNLKTEVDNFNKSLNSSASEDLKNDKQILSCLNKLNEEYKSFSSKHDKSSSGKLEKDNLTQSTSSISSLSSTSAQFKIDDLEMSITKLNEAFNKLICKSLLINQGNNASLIMKNSELENELSDFKNNDLKSFETDLKECDHNTSSLMDTSEKSITSSVSSLNPNQSFDSTSQSSDCNFRTKMNQIKSKYNSLLDASNLYLEGLNDLDSISDSIDKFSNVLCEIEMKLATKQPYNNNDHEYLNNELDNLDTVEDLINSHDGELECLKDLFERFKSNIGKVRSNKKIDSDTQRIDNIIEKFTDRWSNGVHSFDSRKNHLKKMLQTFNEYETVLNAEKDWLKLIKSNITAQVEDINNNTDNRNINLMKNVNSTYDELITRTDSIDALNDKLAQLNELAKDLETQFINSKENLENQINIELIEKLLLKSNQNNNSNQQVEEEEEEKNDDEQLNENLNVFNVINDELNDLNNDYVNQFKILNEIIETFNEKNLYEIPIKLTDINELHKKYMKQANMKARSQNSSTQSPQPHAFFYSSLSPPSSPTTHNTNSPAAGSAKFSVYTHDKYYSQHNYPTCRIVSTMSDYRLTLTDFIDLKLIDNENGLIINPLNGQRLTLTEAIQLEFINSDVKEIANIYDSCNSKLTIKEAIQIELINPIKNEICIKNSKIKLNFYEARLKNLILKPLTLTEAFMLNLIKINGYVRNPINQNFIEFYKCVYNKNLGLFDLDTKHIIDPYRNNKLLSIQEAIECKLIIPEKFQIYLQHLNKFINLYEAYFNFNKISLNLLLYKPEIENIYIKLAIDKLSKAEKREKIGLIEALNYGLINLSANLYFLKANESYITIHNAIELKYIDKELDSILNSSIGIQKNGKFVTIKDCILDLTLILDKQLFKSPINNEYLHFDSVTCKSILNENCLKLIKHLITQINIKSYIISFNTNQTNTYLNTSQTLHSTHKNQDKNVNIIDMKYTDQNSNHIILPMQKVDDIKTMTIDTVKDINSDVIYTVDEAIQMGILDKATLLYTNSSSGKSIALNDAHDRGYLNGHYEPAAKSKQIDYVIDPDTNLKLSLEDSIRLGIYDPVKRVYINRRTHTVLNFKDAVSKGLIEVKPSVQGQTSGKNGNYVQLKIDIENDASNTPPSKVSTPVQQQQPRVVHQNVNVVHGENNLTRVDIKFNDDSPATPTTSNGNNVRLRQKSIIERRAVSYYGCDQSLETLVIDDMRRDSNQLNIEGEMHVYKNEIHIDCDTSRHSDTTTEHEQSTIIDLHTTSKQKPIDTQSIRRSKPNVDYEYYEQQIDIKNPSKNKTGLNREEVTINDSNEHGTQIQITIQNQLDDTNSLSPSSVSSFNTSLTSSSNSERLHKHGETNMKSSPSNRSVVMLNEYIDETSTINVYEQKLINNTIIQKLNDTNAMNTDRIQQQQHETNDTNIKLTVQHDKTQNLMTTSDTRFYENINITKKYSILNVYDPYTGIRYNLNEIYAKKLIDLKYGLYRIPSTGHFVNLQKAIQLGYVNTILLDESVDVFQEHVLFDVNDKQSNKEDTPRDFVSSASSITSTSSLSSDNLKSSSHNDINQNDLYSNRSQVFEEEQISIDILNEVIISTNSCCASSSSSSSRGYLQKLNKNLDEMEYQLNLIEIADDESSTSTPPLLISASSLLSLLSNLSSFDSQLSFELDFLNNDISTEADDGSSNRNEANSDELINNLNKLNGDLTDIEYEIVKQSVLSDTVEILKTQKDDFDRLHNAVSRDDQKMQSRFTTLYESINKATKLKDNLLNQYKDLANRYTAIKTQLDTRQKSFNASLDNIQKFNGEKSKLQKWLQTTDDRLSTIDNYVHDAKHDGDYVSTCKKYETECKNTENFLIAKQSELRVLKHLHQAFVGQTIEFNKTTQAYNSSLKTVQTTKRPGINTECVNLKQLLNETDAKYQETNTKLCLLIELLAKIQVEHVEQTKNWLKNIESTYLTNETTNTDVLKVLSDELQTRKSVTVDNEAITLKINELQSVITQRQANFEDIEKLIAQYKAEYGNLSEYFKRTTNAIELLQPANTQLDQLLLELNQIKKELNLKNVDLTHLKDLYMQIEGKHLLSADSLNNLNQHLIDVNLSYEQLIQIFDKKFTDLKQLNSLLETFYKTRQEYETYLFDLDKSLQVFDNAAVVYDFDVLNRHFTDFNGLLKKYDQYAGQTLDKCNYNGQQILSQQKVNQNIEHGLRSLNELHVSVSEKMNKIKAALISNLDFIKAYYQDLNRVNKQMTEFELKLKKLYQFDGDVVSDDNTNSLLPISRNILEYLLSNLNLLQSELSAIDNDLSLVKQKYPILHDNKELNGKFDVIKNMFTEKLYNFNGFKSNIDAFDEVKMRLKKNFESKSNELNELTSATSLQLQNMGLINEQVNKLNELLDDLNRTDACLLDSLNSNGQLILKTCIKRDCDYVNDDLRSFNEKFKSLNENLSKLIGIKETLKISLNNFNSTNEDLDDNLSKIDAKLQQYQNESNTEQIIHEINFIETNLVPKCNEQISHLNSLVLNDGMLNEELKQAHLQYKTKLTATINDLTKMKFNKKFDKLNKYLNDQLSSSKFNELISGDINRIKQQKYEYDEFHFEIDCKKDEYKQFFNDYHTNNDYDILTKLKTCELNWKLLFTKSQEKKDKLMICYDLAEQFINYNQDLNGWLGEIETKFKQLDSLDTKCRDYIVEQIDNDEHFQKDLKIKLNYLKDFIQTSNELQLSVQCDKQFIEEKMVAIENRFSLIQNENKLRLQALNDRLQKFNDYDDVYNDIVKSLESSEDKLNTLNFNMKHQDLKQLTGDYEKLYGDVTGLKAKIVVLGEITENLRIKNENFNEINEKFAKLLTNINAALAQLHENRNELEKRQKDFNECLNNLINLEHCFGDCIKDEIEFSHEALNVQKSNVTNVKVSFDICSGQIAKLNDCEALNDSNLSENIRDLLKRSTNLNTTISSYCTRLNEISTLAVELDGKCESANDSILSALNCVQTFKDDVNTLLEQIQFDGIKAQVNLINSQLKQLNKEVSSKNSNFKLQHSNVNASETSLHFKIENLNACYESLTQKIYNYEKQYELNAVKTDNLRKTVNEMLLKYNEKFDAMCKCKINLTNIYLIDENLRKLNDMNAHMVNLNASIGDLKANNEQQECESFQLLDKKYGLIKRNYENLNENLKQIKCNSDELKSSLDVKYNFNLNCIEPLILKSQLDRVNELNCVFMKNFNLINNIKEFYENLLNTEEGLLMESHNYDIVFQTCLDREQVELSLNQLDLTFTEKRYLTEKNLSLIKVIYPLCEAYGASVCNVNEQLSRHEISLKNLNEFYADDDKTQILDDLQMNIKNLSESIESIEVNITQQIVSEINGSEQTHDDFIADLNKSIAQVKLKYQQFLNNFDAFYKQHENKKERNLSIIGELDDLNEWLDEVELKIINLDSISYMPEIIKQQLNEQLCINDDIQMQILKYKHLVQKYKKLQRTQQIDDTLELKDKFNKLEMKCENLRVQCAKRLNELEQALVISKTFMDLHVDLRSWFDKIQSDIQLYEINEMPHNRQHHHHHHSKTSATEKDEIEKELSFYKLVERSLNEKKFDFDNLNKNGKQLADLCNANMGTMILNDFTNGGTGGSGVTNEIHLSSDSTSAQHIKSIMENLNQHYDLLKVNVRKRIDNCESLLWKSSELHEKLDNLTVCLNQTCECIEQAEQISAHPDKIKTQLDDNQNLLNDLNKRKHALDILRDHFAQQPNSANDSAVVEINSKLAALNQLWDEIKSQTDDRSRVLVETLECSDQFWTDYNELMGVVNNVDERLKQIDCETLNQDSVLEQQQTQGELIQELEEKEEYVEQVKMVGEKLMQLCGKPDQDEIKRSIEDLDNNWTNAKQTLKNREIELRDTIDKAFDLQQQVLDILEWIKVQKEKFSSLEDDQQLVITTTTSTQTDENGGTTKYVKEQITLLKELKEQIDPKQVDIQLLNQQFNDLKSTIKSSPSYELLETLQEPLNSANKDWKDLQNSIIVRKTSLQNTLLNMGQFIDALDEILKWLEATHVHMDSIGSGDLNEVKLINIELARLGMVENEIKSNELCVDKLKETGKNLIRNEVQANIDFDIHSVKISLQLMIDQWHGLIMKLSDKQKYLNEKLMLSQEYQCDLQDMIVWLDDIEKQLFGSNLLGGLPETAREKLEKFLQHYSQLDLNESKVDKILADGQSLIENSLIEQNSNLHQSIQLLSDRWAYIRRKAKDRKEKLENAYSDAVEFNDLHEKLIAWLTETEKVFNTLKPLTRQFNRIAVQLNEHHILQRDIIEHRGQVAALHRLGTELQYHCQRQDSSILRNLLFFANNRYQKLVSRSGERTIQLDRGYMESKYFYETSTELNAWLGDNLNYLNDPEFIISNQPNKIKQQIARHKEFHRQVGEKQHVFDTIIKTGKKLIEKSDSEADKHYLADVLNDLKAKWQALCYQSIERQKKLEDALLCTGQFREALQSVCDWLRQAEIYLDGEKPVNGDFESVLALIDQNQRFQLELEHKSEQILMLHKIGSDLMKNSVEDSSDLNDKLNEVNEEWNNVQDLNKSYILRLDNALNLAKEFHQCVKQKIEWLNTIEQQLRINKQYYDNENEILELIEKYQIFLNDLKEQEIHIKQCMEFGNEILKACIPESEVNIKHWLAVIQQKWDEIIRLIEIKLKQLQDSLETLKENEALLNELAGWLSGAEGHLSSCEQKQLPNSIEEMEELIMEHQEFQNELVSKQTGVERITKNNCVKDSDYLYVNQQNGDKKKSNSKTSQKQNNNIGMKTPEPKMRNPRVKSLFDKWRRVWLMSLERSNKLKQGLERLGELERLKNFSFDEWRTRYMNWLKDHRGRIMDFFRRQDKDHDGKITREEFIEGILSSNFQTSRLELEAVADIFDLDEDGFIDYKEFFATLKPSASNKPIQERVRDEVQKQVSMCKCSKSYHASQISEEHYRFGNSQKLFLVRILTSSVMVRVGGGWQALDEFLIKYDPCRAKGRTNFELREPYLRDQNNTLSQQRSPQRQLQTSLNTSGTAAHNRQRGKSSSLYSTSLIPIALRYLRMDRNQSLTSTSRSLIPTSGMNYDRLLHTPRSSLSQSNEALLLTNSPARSVANSHSGSLGASISDLSSEAASDIYGDSSMHNKNDSRKSSIRSSTKSSKLPVPKKQQQK